jgi:asparagine synthase (glutamine-hydrolysing)
MCGICGWVSRGASDHLNNDDLKKMTDILAHRGPDDSGYFIRDNIALGHRRLSIIDIQSGHQPMADDRGHVVVLNGEIYNYLELRKELLKSGFVFKTNSDTEVLLAAYSAWGYKCIDKFIGMFSFVIWDTTNQKLFIARDRLGKKPFFYFSHNGFFGFASEIKSLLTLPQVKTSVDIDPYAISDYLSLGYILTPKTIFKNIKKLPAAHYAIYDIHEKKFTITEYWKLEDYFLAAKEKSNEKKLNNDFLELFKQSTSIRLRSDVPLGGFLSGGLDSTSIVSNMKNLSDTKIKTFCIGFSKKSYDESKYAKIAADHIGVDNHIAFYKKITATELSKLVWYFDEPFSDNSFIPTYQLNKLARQDVTTALSGDGADEILAGYSTYIADSFYKKYSMVPNILQSVLYKAAQKYLKPSYKKVSWDYKITQFLRASGLSHEKAHYWWRVIFSEAEKEKIMSPELINDCNHYDPFDVFNDYFKKVQKANFLDQTLFVDIKTWLQDDILVKVDRMSMANSLEVRSPFLDHRLVELTAKMSTKAKLSWKTQKVVLRNSMRKFLPSESIQRSKKGFNTPFQKGWATSLTSSSLKDSGLFTDKFQLHKENSDITFKSFNFEVLTKWFELFNNYKKTGEWTSIEYDD